MRDQRRPAEETRTLSPLYRSDTTVRRLFVDEIDIVVSERSSLGSYLTGAHAQLRADRFLSRDRSFYKSYFPHLRRMS